MFLVTWLSSLNKSNINLYFKYEEFVLAMKLPTIGFRSALSCIVKARVSLGNKVGHHCLHLFQIGFILLQSLLVHPVKSFCLVTDAFLQNTTSIDIHYHLTLLQDCFHVN